METKILWRWPPRRACTRDGPRDDRTYHGGRYPSLPILPRPIFIHSGAPPAHGVWLEMSRFRVDVGSGGSLFSLGCALKRRLVLWCEAEARMPTSGE